MLELIKKNPTACQAVQWTGENKDEILVFLGDKFYVEQHNTRIKIGYVAGGYRHMVRQNRWIVREEGQIKCYKTKEILSNFTITNEVDRARLEGELVDSQEVKADFFNNAYNMFAGE